MIVPRQTALLTNRLNGSGWLALRFIFVLVGVYATVGAIALVLTRFVPFRPVPGQVVFPPAFWWTTGLLALGSGLFAARRFLRPPRATKAVSPQLVVRIGLWGRCSLEFRFTAWAAWRVKSGCTDDAQGPGANVYSSPCWRHCMPCTLRWR